MLNDAEAATVFAALGKLAEGCADADRREVHVWPASPPHVLLTPHAFWSDPLRPYLLAVFDDIRLCIGCPDGVLDLKFGARIDAHVGLGRRPPGGDVLSLFTTKDRFANVYYDTCPEAIAIEPKATQSLGFRGDAFGAIDGLDAAGRVALLDGLQEAFRVATARALHDMRAALLPFEDPAVRWDRHVYDAFLLAQMTPVRTGLYVAIAPIDPLRLVLPDSNGAIAIDVTAMGCREARDTVGAFGLGG